MNIAEDNKWSIQQQQQQQQQIPHSPHHQHPTMSPPINETYIQSFQYDGQSSQGQMHQQQLFMPIPAPPTPSTPRPNGSPSTVTSSNSGANSPTVDRKIMDNRQQQQPPPPQPPPFTTSSFHAAPFQSGVQQRKRRTDTLNFPVDAGPFFSPTTQHYNVYSVDRANSFKLRINSKVDRGFFLADNDWTCYRRNYFQISSAFSISSPTHPVNEADITCLIEVDGHFHTITQFQLGISARVSNSDKKIELVQHTPKRDKGPQMVPVPKPIRPGGNLNLSSVGSNSNIVTFERIQFKTATANNGKRRAAQQYYVVMVDLYAQVENGEQYRVATSTSASLVVRGRSPGHYADNHERYNPMSAMNHGFPGDRHLTFPHGPPPNGAPVMPQDFNGNPFPAPYGQYQPFPGFPPVPGGPMRNDALIMLNPNGPPPFHPQHPHQQYMVPTISESNDNNNNNNNNGNNNNNNNNN